MRTTYLHLLDQHSPLCQNKPQATLLVRPHTLFRTPPDEPALRWSSVVDFHIRLRESPTKPYIIPLVLYFIVWYDNRSEVFFTF